MAAWWWWSIPYTIVCPLFADLLFPETVHTVMAFPLAFVLLTWISSMLWGAVALYRMVIAHTLTSSRKMKLMLLGSVIASVFLPITAQLGL
jgi:hypothetical protein